MVRVRDRDRVRVRGRVRGRGRGRAARELAIGLESERTCGISPSVAHLPRRYREI